MSVILPAAEIPGAAQESTSQDILAAVDGLEAGVAVLATEATATGIAAALTLLATEATATGIASDVTTLVTNSEQWPYAEHDYIGTAFDENTFTEVNTFKTGGATGTSVGTVTLVFSDALKSSLLSTSYSPAVKVGG
jgi:acetyl-CoA carboxylase carboxyltransferase component